MLRRLIALVIQPYEYGADASKATCIWQKRPQCVELNREFNNGALYIDPAE
jgi:hypothetical protein